MAELQRRAWRLRGAGRSFVVVRAIDLGEEEAAAPSLFLSTRVGDWLFGGDRDARRTVLEIYDELRGGAPGSRTFDDAVLRRYVQPALERAFDEGELVGLEQAWTTGVARADDHAGDDAAQASAPAPVSDGKSWFEVMVVDEVGSPISGLSMAFTVGGVRRSVDTDGSGVARFDDATESFASVRVASIAALRTAVTPRWKRPRKPTVKPGPHVFLEQLADDIPPVSLESETRAVLAVTPFFRCNELGGAHFEFGRSFVLGTGLDTLAMIADVLGSDDARRGLVFGHTDQSGSEALNKELSERRAKAIFALLTHDDAGWEELFSGSADGTHWKEKWGTKEVQHMLNTLGVPDDEGEALDEDGAKGPKTKSAVSRFQRGDYANPRPGRAPIEETGEADEGTRKELFLSYATRVSEDPVDKGRFTKVGGASFMGCGEYNPLSDEAKDAGSRRAVVFVFDPAAEPQALPCALRDTGPCVASGVHDPPPEDDDTPPAEKKPYRCSVYREVASVCPCAPTESLMAVALQLHDRKYKPCAHIPYRVNLPGGTVATGHTRQDGTLVVVLPQGGPHKLSVSYTPEGDDQELTLGATVFPDEDVSDDVFIDQIRNMGFGEDEDPDKVAITRFQLAHPKLSPTGVLDDDTKQAVRDADDQPLGDVLESQPAPTATATA